MSNLSSPLIVKVLMTEQRGSRWSSVLALVIVAALAGGIVYLWQREQIDDLRRELVHTRAAEREASAEYSAAALSAATADSRLGRLRERFRSAESRERDLQDCVARVVDEDAPGTRTVSFGFLALEGRGGTQMSFDEAEWLVGEPATEAAIADGVIEAGETVPNDYYIRNSSRSRTAVEVQADAAIVTVTASRKSIPSPRCVGRQTFRRMMIVPRAWEASVQRSPFWLVMKGGEIIRISEQYLP